jgi:dTDP-4-dehydrorhamnose reductase
MTILLTGASGLLGANFVEAARSRHVNVIAVYNQHSLRVPGVETVRADLTDATSADDLVRSFRPLWTVHCAAVTNVDWCESHPKETWDIHVEASRHLAAAMRKAGGRLVYISTDAVFDGTGGNYAEEDRCAPVNVYATTKLAGEQVVQDSLDSSLIVRTNMYGWNMQNKCSLAEWILSELEAQQLVSGFDDVIFTPILVNDLAEIVIEMMEQQLSGVYHVAGSQACSKHDFALHLADVFGLNQELIRRASVDRSALQARRPKNTSLQTAKISRALNRPMPDIQSGLQRFKMLRDSGYVSQLKTHTGR